MCTTSLLSQSSLLAHAVSWTLATLKSEHITRQVLRLLPYGTAALLFAHQTVFTLFSSRIRLSSRSGGCPLLTPLSKRLMQPFQALVYSITRDGRARLQVPCVAQATQGESVDHFVGWNGAWKVLLVCHDENDGIMQSIFGQHLVELPCCL